MTHADVVQSVTGYFKNRKFAEFRVRKEVSIAIGAKAGLADIVLSDKDGRFFAIAECKMPNQMQSGLLQLQSYLAASNTRFGLLAASMDSDKWGYWENIGESKFRKITKSDFEFGVLNNPPGVFNPKGTQKQQAQIQAKDRQIQIQKKVIGNWKYAALGLGIGLALALVAVVWLSLAKTESSDVHMLNEVAFIPAGEFRMGGSDSDAESDEHPEHTVHVDAFFIDKYEVTNVQYKQFVDANPQWQKDRIPSKFHNGKYLNLWQDNTYPPDKESHPVVHVSWYAAMAYAQWTGRRLPTEAEWEKAARGRLVGAKYPWGDEIDSAMANYGGELGDTKPVGSYPPNDYDLYDMAGNVMEWCLDAYDESFYNHSPSRNPIAGGSLVDIVNNFLSVMDYRVVRSGCWYNVPMHVRVADRYGTSPDHASRGRGFRCARSATSFSK